MAVNARFRQGSESADQGSDNLRWFGWEADGGLQL